MIKFAQDVCKNGKLIDGCCVPSDSMMDGKITGAETVTVPSGARFCVFSFSDDIYVRYDGGTAYVPAGAIASGTVERNPSVVRVNGVTSFSIIPKSLAYITLRFYG